MNFECVTVCDIFLLHFIHILFIISSNVSTINFLFSWKFLLYQFNNIFNNMFVIWHDTLSAEWFQKSHESEPKGVLHECNRWGDSLLLLLNNHCCLHICIVPPNILVFISLGRSLSHLLGGNIYIQGPLWPTLVLKTYLLRYHIC